MEAKLGKPTGLKRQLGELKRKNTPNLWWREIMLSLRQVWIYVLLSILIFVVHAAFVAVQTSAGTINATAERDGQHDFDFLIGSWKIHLKRRLHPLTGSNTWVEFDGTDVVRKVWDGANLDEFETDSPSGHIEGLTLRTYNPQTHQWSLYWANRKDGSMSISPQIGEFKDGRGEFYAQDTLNGKLIYVRYAWSNTATDIPHFEQSFSNDGGKTWEVNWITDQTRVPDDSIKPYDSPVDPNAGTQAAGARDGQHDFDPLIGGWTFD